MTSKAISDLPGPGGLLLLGNILQLNMEKLHVVLQRWRDVFGPLYVFRIATRPVVVISDTELIHQISRARPETYRGSSSLRAVLKEIGIEGVVTAEGETWYRHRRLAQQALDPNHLRQFFPTLVKVTHRLKQRLDRAAAAGTPVEVQKDLMCYTIDVMTNLAFGYDMNTLESGDDGLQRHIEKIPAIVSRRVMMPFPYWRYFKLSADRELDKSMEVVRAEITGAIARARARLADEPGRAANPANLLEAMIVACNEGDSAINDEEILSNALLMLGAAEDTTANTSAWLMHLLCQHPQVLERMRQEVDAVFGETDVPQNIKDVDRLTYVEAAVNETLRLVSIAPIRFVEPNEDVEVGGVRIPEGTLIMLLSHYEGLQESNFENARGFRPERWLAGSAGCPHNRNAYMPFGSGPRFCPGRGLALLEIKTVMAMVCRNFSISAADGFGPVEDVFSITRMPSNLFIRFEPRSR